MSTVIFHNGLMYADTRLSFLNQVSFSGRELPDRFSTTRKMYHANDKIYGAVGDVSTWKLFKKRGYKGKPFLSFKKVDLAVIIEYDGKDIIGWHFKIKKFLFFWWIVGWEKVILNAAAPALMGSGEPFASEAMRLGLTPIEAIKYASDRDPYTNDIIEIGLLDAIY